MVPHWAQIRDASLDAISKSRMLYFRGRVVASSDHSVWKWCKERKRGMLIRNPHDASMEFEHTRAVHLVSTSSIKAEPLCDLLFV